MQAAAGEGPTFSLFGIIGAKDSMSEGAAYGSDQSDPVSLDLQLQFAGKHEISHRA